MKTLRRLALVSAVCGVAAGCSGNSTGSNLPVVVGTWTVTKFEFVSAANSSTREDAIAQGNTATIVITATAFAATSQGSNVFTGTYTETATTLVINGQDSGGHSETLTFALTVSGSTLSLTGATTTHNFGSGEVSAYLNITATKQ